MGDRPLTGETVAPVRSREREVYLATRVLDALLREDYGELSRHVADGRLTLPGGRAVALTGERDGMGRHPGFLAERVVDDDALTLDEVLAATRALAGSQETITSSPRRMIMSLFQHQSELARWRQRAAWTRAVVRAGEQRSLRRRRQDLSAATACSTSARILA